MIKLSNILPEIRVEPKGNPTIREVEDLNMKIRKSNEYKKISVKSPIYTFMYEKGYGELWEKHPTFTEYTQKELNIIYKLFLQFAKKIGIDLNSLKEIRVVNKITTKEVKNLYQKLNNNYDLSNQFLVDLIAIDNKYNLHQNLLDQDLNNLNYQELKNLYNELKILEKSLSGSSTFKKVH